jgi:hypothetical protein
VGQTSGQLVNPKNINTALPCRELAFSVCPSGSSRENSKSGIIPEMSVVFQCKGFSHDCSVSARNIMAACLSKRIFFSQMASAATINQSLERGKGCGHCYKQ